MKELRLIKRNKINTICDIVNYSCTEFAKRTAFAEKTEGVFKKISYSSYYSDIEALGLALNACGYTNKKIALIGNSGYAWALVYMSVVCRVGTIVIINNEIPMGEVENILSQSEVCAVFCNNNRIAEIKSISQNLLNRADVFSLENDLVQMIDLGKTLPKRDWYVPDAGSPASLIFTSGTTGEAKGILLSHKNICSDIESAAQYTDINETDVFLSVLPMYHMYECTCGFLGSIYLGAEIAFCSSLKNIWGDIKITGATVMLGVPLIFERLYGEMLREIEKKGKIRKFRMAIRINKLLKSVGFDFTEKFFRNVRLQFGKIRLFVSGAAFLSPETVKGFNEIGITMLQGYGLTECSPIVTLNHYDYIKPKSVGLAIPGVEIKIDMPSDDGKGEILVKGKNVAKKYYNKSEALEASSDEWFYTGDIGYIDNEGFLYITGRKKNVIIDKSGKNIYPEEIESCINSSPYIMESLVGGVFDTKDDSVKITAQIFPDEEACRKVLKDRFSEDAVYNMIKDEIDLINSSLQSFKRVAEFKIRKEPFIKTSVNEIKRFMEKQ